MTIATNVLDWSGSESNDLSDAELNAPFKIDVVSQGVSKIFGRDTETFFIKIYAHDWDKWRVEGKGRGHFPVASTASESGVSIDDSISLSGGSSASASYPVDYIQNTPNTPTGIISDKDFGYIYAPGAYPGMLRATSLGNIEFTDDQVIDEGGHGVVEFKSLSKSAQVYSVGIWLPGIHYFLCHIPGTERKEIIQIQFNDPVNTSIEVRDYCTDEAIPGAVITALGAVYTADANGVVNFGKLSTGQTIPVIISANGYHDSDTDTLNNDTITT